MKNENENEKLDILLDAERKSRAAVLEYVRTLITNKKIEPVTPKQEEP